MSLNNVKFYQQITIAYGELGTDIGAIVLAIALGSTIRWTAKLRIIVSMFSLRLIISLLLCSAYYFCTTYLPFYAAIIIPIADFIFMNLLDFEAILQIYMVVRVYFRSLEFSNTYLAVCLTICVSFACCLGFYWQDFILQSDYMLLAAVQFNGYCAAIYSVYAAAIICEYHWRSYGFRYKFAGSQIDSSVEKIVSEYLRGYTKACYFVVFVVAHNLLVHILLTVAQVFFVVSYREAELAHFIKWQVAYRTVQSLVVIEGLLYEFKYLKSYKK